MSATETKQLGIEFERRIQTIDPTYEIINKLDTETIYSFLNEYQDKYVNQLLITSGQPVKADEVENKAVVSKIQGALRVNSTFDVYTNIESVSSNWAVSCAIPEDFFRYISSYVYATSSYNGKDGKLRCILISDKEYQYLQNTLFDEDRILRYPLVKMSDNTLQIITDRYTNITSVGLEYYKKPVRFTVLGETINCELPSECFDDIVTGAVDLYFATRYKLAIAKSAARRKNKKDTEDDD